MSKETLTWFGIPIIMGIGFLLFRIAMDLPTEETTNMLVGLIFLAVFVFGSIGAYKMLRTFWQDTNTSRPTSVNPTPESQSPTSKPAPVESEVSAIPTRADNPAIPASDVHTEAPASDATTTPAAPQPKNTALFLSILISLLLGVTIGLIDPTSMPDTISRAPGITIDELISRQSAGQDLSEKEQRAIRRYEVYQQNRSPSGPRFERAKEHEAKVERLAGIAQDVLNNKLTVTDLTDDVIPQGERQLFLQVLSEVGHTQEPPERHFGQQLWEGAAHGTSRVIRNLGGHFVEAFGSDEKVRSHRFGRGATAAHFSGRARDVQEMPWMSGYFIRKATAGAAEMAPAVAIGLLILIIIVAQRVRKKSCSSQTAARIPGGFELKSRH